MDRSLSYTGSAWSVPNLRPTRAQTAASAYRPHRIRTRSFERPRTQSAAYSGRGRNGSGSDETEMGQQFISGNSAMTHGRPLLLSQRRRGESSRGATPNFSFSSTEDGGLTEENLLLREKIRELERSLLKSQQQEEQHKKVAAFRRARNKVIEIIDETPSFDPASNTLPVSFGIMDDIDRFRNVVLPVDGSFLCQWILRTTILLTHFAPVLFLPLALVAAKDTSRTSCTHVVLQ